MNEAHLHKIAASLHEAGISGAPTAILTRDVPLYEVEFEALECVQESKLRPADWAVLALARAMGRLSPALVDEYLGLGATVSEVIVRRLLDDQLLHLELQLDNAASGQADTGLLALTRHLLTFSVLGRVESKPSVAPKSTSAPTAARKLHPSRASDSPMCRLSDLGTIALERGVIPQRRVHKARLVFLAEPLMFINVVDDKQQRHTARHRLAPLQPGGLPLSLRTLDDSLSLPAEQRMVACGIGTSVPGLSGQLVRIVPGSQWEVRHVTRRIDGKHQPQSAALVLAAFHTTSDELRWHTFLQHGARPQACPQINAASLVDVQELHPAGLLAAVRSDLPLPAGTPLRGDGAYELSCDSEQMINMTGGGDRPCDVLLQALLGPWHAGLRIHAVPANREAARQAYFAFLSRSDAALRRDFDATCAEVAARLADYWGSDHGLPSADEAAMNLWPQVGLRAALCMRRLQRDLVSPYAPVEQLV
ncbi:hypothetical protein L3V59_41405 [Burkholderia aenigmatica]|uniref:hypothetical protein n=1 Tax=Burkholderia aenigmatica TaxID=2015348 RepID=UPI001F2092ED|nr:hypothetical protein [Burkholderia aenigmatica]UKD17106.1 hypothetical protein L3V59_41405 [Burkholderia aenigmatica]